MKDKLIMNLLNTTFTSTVQSHQRLKELSAYFGCSEDIISRFAISRSLQTGTISQDWKPSIGVEESTISNGKSIRGKTLFKSDLSLFLVMLASVEDAIDSEDVREYFGLHWERGIELISQEVNEYDWLEYLSHSLNV